MLCHAASLTRWKIRFKPSRATRKTKTMKMSKEKFALFAAREDAEFYLEPLVD